MNAGAGRLRRFPVFYGWVLVATAFVTMGIVVNARTAFSLFFPSILDEFGWSRALTAATFTTGLLASNAFTPFLGVLMDRVGPRVVFPIGLGLMSLGLALATGVSAPWQLHLRGHGPVGGGSGARPHRELRAGVLDRDRVQRGVGGRHVAGGASESAARRRSRATMRRNNP